MPLLLDNTSVRFMPKLSSGCSMVAPSTGLVKDNQPEPELKRSRVSNNGAPGTLAVQMRNDGVVVDPRGNPFNRVGRAQCQ